MEIFVLVLVVVKLVGILRVSDGVRVEFKAEERRRCRDLEAHHRIHPWMVIVFRRIPFQIIDAGHELTETCTVFALCGEGTPGAAAFALMIVWEPVVRVVKIIDVIARSLVV